MKNRGFTLIELLVVIAILATISVIVTVSLSKTFTDTNQKQCDEFVEKIETAACVYTSLSNKKVICERNDCEPIKLRLLVTEGYINEEIDSCTNGAIDLDETISIFWDESGEKICEYNGVKTYER